MFYSVLVESSWILSSWLFLSHVHSILALWVLLSQFYQTYLLCESILVNSIDTCFASILVTWIAHVCIHVRRETCSHPPLNQKFPTVKTIPTITIPCLHSVLCVSSCYKGSIRYFGIFNNRALGSNLRFRNPEKILEGEDIRVWPTLDSVFSCYGVMVRPNGVLSRKNYVPRVTSKVNKSSIVWWISYILVCHYLVVCCIHICCRLLCVWYRILSLAWIPHCRAQIMRAGTPSLGLE